ncbi:MULTISPECIES: winged helix-turn-helix transcriptional regulator [Protofrankia]|uniref:Transcriptional regulator, HxlR family n=1 Tax=Candidatus Protofrankia datiscae TaxID=2716812 RepID=F8B0F7_9ACTN|nr:MULTISPECIES: helix-turn-helix domain-containing protein [Protofrankia]AEH09706.1 transcriptional regulator, HxlR family [Candidatus Protofrankia datiscae]
MVGPLRQAGVFGAAGGDARGRERAGPPGVAGEPGEDRRERPDLPVPAPVALRNLGGEHPDPAGIASNLLATRLDTLVAAGVLRRVPYQEPGDRQRFEYQLTEQGLDLRPTLVALLEWGDKYLADPRGPSVVVRHRPANDEDACDEPVRVVLTCAAGHIQLPPHAVHRAPGPGARFLEAT